MVRNLWHDPHAKRKSQTWGDNANGLTASLTGDGHWSYSVTADSGTINPFGTDANLSCVAQGMVVVCVALFSTGAWPINSMPNQQVLVDGEKTGLWVTRNVAGSPLLWAPYWRCRAAEPLTVRGLAVYTPEAWTLVEEAWKAGSLPTPIITYGLMPLQRS